MIAGDARGHTTFSRESGARRVCARMGAGSHEYGERSRDGCRAIEEAGTIPQGCWAAVGTFAQSVGFKDSSRCPVLFSSQLRGSDAHQSRQFHRRYGPGLCVRHGRRSGAAGSVRGTLGAGSVAARRDGPHPRGLVQPAFHAAEDDAGRQGDVVGHTEAPRPLLGAFPSARGDARRA